MEPNRLVIHYTGGTVLKGHSEDFSPNKPHFDLFQAAAAETTGKASRILVQELKGVFFVRDFVGNSQYNERKAFSDKERPAGRKVEVTFKDGEVLVGSTMGYDPQRQGFFFFPVDPQSNNLRVFVVNSAVSKVRFL